MVLEFKEENIREIDDDTFDKLHDIVDTEAWRRFWLREEKNYVSKLQ